MKEHIIINVGRQLGSGGHDIGRMLALDFQAKYYDRELLNLAAKESGFSEKFFEQNDEKKGFFKGLFNMQTSHFSGGSMYKTNFSQESLFQFQSDAIRKAAKGVKGILSVELSAGQLIEDIKLATDCNYPVDIFYRLGGNVPAPDEILNALKEKLVKKLG
jgi:hypothetical protein